MQLTASSTRLKTFPSWIRNITSLSKTLHCLFITTENKNHVKLPEKTWTNYSETCSNFVYNCLDIESCEFNLHKNLE